MRWLIAAIALTASVEASADEVDVALFGQDATDSTTRQVATTYSATLPPAADGALSTTVDVAASVARVDRRTSDSYVVQIWQDRQTITQRNLSLSPRFEWAKIYGLGLGFSSRGSEIASGRSVGLNPYAWFLHETLRVGAGYRRNDDDVHSAEYIDVDAARVITPSELTGEVWTLDTTWLASETTILEASGGSIFKNDRPRADFGTLKVRQYIKPAAGALHLSTTQFKNVGALPPISPIGEVRAQTHEAQWHQRLGSIVSAIGYRYNIEEHVRRAAPRTAKDVGSDLVWVRAGWRFWQDVWTDPATEIYMSYGNYRSSESIKAQNYSVGIRRPL
jgi:hypothetical protein